MGDFRIGIIFCLLSSIMNFQEKSVSGRELNHDSDRLTNALKYGGLRNRPDPLAAQYPGHKVDRKHSFFFLEERMQNVQPVVECSTYTNVHQNENFKVIHADVNGQISADESSKFCRKIIF